MNWKYKAIDKLKQYEEKKQATKTFQRRNVLGTLKNQLRDHPHTAPPKNLLN